MKAFDLKAETRTALHDLADQGEVRPEDCMRMVVQLVSAVKSQLDGSYTICESCSLKHYNYYEQHLMWTRVKAFGRKARQIAEELERRWNDEEDGRPLPKATSEERCRYCE